VQHIFVDQIEYKFMNVFGIENTNLSLLSWYVINYMYKFHQICSYLKYHIAVEILNNMYFENYLNAKFT